MSPEEKKQHHELVKELEDEVEKAEHEAEGEVRGLERKDVRQDAVGMAKVHAVVGCSAAVD